jgi:hypothetical protein
MKISPVSSGVASNEGCSPLNVIDDKTLCRILSHLSLEEVVLHVLPALPPSTFQRIRHGVPWKNLGPVDEGLYCRFLVLACFDEVEELTHRFVMDNLDLFEKAQDLLTGRNLRCLHLKGASFVHCAERLSESVRQVHFTFRGYLDGNPWRKWHPILPRPDQIETVEVTVDNPLSFTLPIFQRGFYLFDAFPGLRKLGFHPGPNMEFWNSSPLESLGRLVELAITQPDVPKYSVNRPNFFLNFLVGLPNLQVLTIYCHPRPSPTLREVLEPCFEDYVDPIIDHGLSPLPALHTLKIDQHWERFSDAWTWQCLLRVFPNLTRLVINPKRSRVSSKKIAPERSMLDEVLPSECQRLEYLEVNNAPVKLGTVFAMLKRYEELVPEKAFKLVCFNEIVYPAQLISPSDRADVDALKADERYDVVFDEREDGFTLKVYAK